MDNLMVKCFLDLAECLNFSKVAEINNITQSSVSKAILRMEKEVGVNLIDRSKRPISLTPAGKCLQGHLQKISRQYSVAMREIELLKNPAKETLRVLNCPRSYAIKNASHDFMEQNRNIIITSFQTADIRTVVNTFLKENYDFAISPRPMLIPPQLKAIRLYDDSLYLVVSKENPLSSLSTVSLHDLDGQTFVTSYFSTYLTMELQNYFNFTPHIPDIESFSPGREQAFHNISRNLGIGLFLGRDITLFSPVNTVNIPVRELADFPVVLLENINAADSEGKKTFRGWFQRHLENYVCPRIC